MRICFWAVFSPFLWKDVKIRSIFVLMQLLMQLSYVWVRFKVFSFFFSFMSVCHRPTACSDFFPSCSGFWFRTGSSCCLFIVVSVRLPGLPEGVIYRFVVILAIRAKTNCNLLHIHELHCWRVFLWEQEKVFSGCSTMWNQQAQSNCGCLWGWNWPLPSVLELHSDQKEISLVKNSSMSQELVTCLSVTTIVSFSQVPTRFCWFSFVRRASQWGEWGSTNMRSYLHVVSCRLSL